LQGNTWNTITHKQGTRGSWENVEPQRQRDNSIRGSGYGLYRGDTRASVTKEIPEKTAGDGARLEYQGVRASQELGSSNGNMYKKKAWD